MSKFPSFLEYLNDKGNVVEKPEVEVVPDYHGTEEKTPPGSKVPYKTPLTPKAAAKGEKGLAELGDDKLKYEPDTGIKYDVKKDVMKEAKDAKALAGDKAVTAAVADYKGPRSDAPKGGKPYVSKGVKAGDKALGELGSAETKYEPDTDTSKGIERKTKTERFLGKTKDMSLAEFTRYMLEECGCGQVSGEDLPYVTAYSTGKIQPHPPEAIRYISALADKNDGILENLVSTMVSMGYLNKLLKAIFSYPQAYEELTALLGDEEAGADRCKSLAGAMNSSYNKFVSDQESMYESVSSPIGFDDEDDEEEEHHDHHHDDEDSDDDLGDEDMEGDMEDMDGEDHEDMGDDEGEEDMGGDDEGHDHDEMDEPPHEEPKPKKLKKKFAHHHLLDAMKGHEHMMRAMRGE